MCSRKCRIDVRNSRIRNRLSELMIDHFYSENDALDRIIDEIRRQKKCRKLKSSCGLLRLPA